MLGVVVWEQVAHQRKVDNTFPCVHRCCRRFDVSWFPFRKQNSTSWGTSPLVRRWVRLPRSGEQICGDCMRLWAALSRQNPELKHCIQSVGHVAWMRRMHRRCARGMPALGVRPGASGIRSSSEPLLLYHFIIRITGRQVTKL